MGAVALAAAIVAVVAIGSAAAAASGGAQSALRQQCRDPYPGTRAPSNPLMLPAAPGSSPLTGARFFVDGPRHGSAASAIAPLVGLNPKAYTDGYSWVSFEQGPLPKALAKRPSLESKVTLLKKIASQPEAQRLSSYVGGGGPGAVYSQAQKLFCHNFTADPGSIPVLDTYFLHPTVPRCPSPRQVAAAGPSFRRQVNETAQATGNRPVVFLLEIDAIGASRCVQRRGALPGWEALLRYEARVLGSLPHTVTYLEAGYSDGNNPSYTAKVLNASGVRTIRGFFTNDTHNNWTIKEIRWGQRVSRMTGGAHFIVNTATNGRGPLLNRHPSTQGIQVLCNPPGRGLGPLPSTNPIDPMTGRPFAGVDAFLWTSPPGNSTGKCNGGPAPGNFWVAGALGLASRANGQLGPGYPSQPY
jgi:endoglucanase